MGFMEDDPGGSTINRNPQKQHVCPCVWWITVKYFNVKKTTSLWNVLKTVRLKHFRISRGVMLWQVKMFVSHEASRLAFGTQTYSRKGKRSHNSVFSPGFMWFICFSLKEHYGWSERTLFDLLFKPRHSAHTQLLYDTIFHPVSLFKPLAKNN